MILIDLLHIRVGIIGPVSISPRNVSIMSDVTDKVDNRKTPDVNEYKEFIEFILEHYIPDASSKTVRKKIQLLEKGEGKNRFMSVMILIYNIYVTF